MVESKRESDELLRKVTQKLKLQEHQARLEIQQISRQLQELENVNKELRDDKRNQEDKVFHYARCSFEVQSVFSDQFFF